MMLLLLIGLSLSVMGFGPRLMEEETVEEEVIVEEEEEKPCTVNDHYKVYLAIDEVYVLDDIGYKSDDESIASVATNRVSGHKVGKTILRKDCNTYEVEVTDMITAPYASEEKPQLTCGLYTAEDNEYLDEILKTKKKGGYNVVQIDPDYVPALQECKDVFGVTFEQGHNNFRIDASLLQNIVTKNKELPEAAVRDMIVALITLKYTQSNSVCYVKDGQAIGVGAGQQSRIHCTRLAGQKADNWLLRQHPKVLGLQFVDGIRRPDRDNAIDVYLSDEYEDVLADGVWQTRFKVRPEVLTLVEKKTWIATQSGVTCGSDAFFPFGDNVERAHKSGVQYIAEPGGSIRDDNVIETADKYGMVMAFTGMRLFHH